MEGFQPNTEKGESPAEKGLDTVREGNDPAQEWRVEQEMVRSVIDTFDEEELQNIFKELAGKAGIDIRTLDVPPLSDIKILVDKEYSAQGHSSNTEIALNEAAIPNDGERPLKHQILWVVIHEYLHAISSSLPEIEEEHDEKYRFATFTGKTGVAKTVVNVVAPNNNDGLNLSQEHKIDTNINEGITEWLTGKVFGEYVNRTGDLSARSAEKEGRIEGIQGGYWLEQTNVNLYIHFLAELSEQPRTVIENSLVRTYLRNGEVVPEEFTETLPVSESTREAITSVMREQINSAKFEGVLLYLKQFLPEERQQAFEDIVTETYSQTYIAYDIKDKKQTNE